MTKEIKKTIGKRELERLFFKVRNNFIWTADDEHELVYDGKVIRLNDHWGLMTPDARGILRGDCEDFCLYISKLLKTELSIPKSKRKLTYCKTESGEGHMILTVKSNESEYVFDNRQRRLTTLNSLKRAGYSDFARPHGPINGPWVQI